jgi:hypothetical protein
MRGRVVSGGARPRHILRTRWSPPRIVSGRPRARPCNRRPRQKRDASDDAVSAGRAASHEGAPRDAGSFPSQSSGTLYEALREQLGLPVVAQKEAVIVIDHLGRLKGLATERTHAGSTRMRFFQWEMTNQTKAVTMTSSTARWKRWKIALNRGSVFQVAPSFMPTQASA